MIDSNLYKKSDLFHKIEFDNSMVSVNISKVVEHPIHLHDVLEIIFILKGSVEVKSAYKTFTLIKGEYILINYFELHSIKKTSNEAVIAYLHFSQNDNDTVPLLIDDIDMLKKDNTAYYCIKENIINIINASIKSSDNTNKLNVYVQDTIKNLYTNLQYATYNILGDKNEYDEKELHVSRLSDILDYLYIHYDENLTLDYVSEKFNISRYYLAHILKKGYGRSFIELLNMVRVDRSEFHILNNNTSISHICNEVGFSSQNYFTKCFKDYFGCTPLQYRKLYKKETLKYKNFEENEYVIDTSNQELIDIINSENKNEKLLRILLGQEDARISIMKEFGNHSSSKILSVSDGNVLDLEFDCDTMTIVIKKVSSQ